MASPSDSERHLVVFGIWLTAGLSGFASLMEGVVHGSPAWGATAVALIVAGFVAHIVVNAVFGHSFSAGETALGIGLYGASGALFIAAWLSGALGSIGYVTGIALFGVLALGFLAYLVTRHGLRGAFSHFHGQASKAHGRET